MSSERPVVGERIQDRYRVVRELGSGAFGTVYLAEDETARERVAIRILPRSAAPALSVARAGRSASRSSDAGATPHPGLVGVMERGEIDPDRSFMVMELVEGRRLSEVLSGSKPLDIATARRWALDLGSTIEALHNMGRAHGALRPRNVMVFTDGRTKLMDLELLGLRDTPTSPGARAASPPAEYLAPEQIRGGPVTEKTDVYAFATILYEMFAGVPPFAAPTREAVLAKQLSDSPAPMHRRRAVPIATERIITQALNKDPELRPWMHEMLNGLWGEGDGPVVARAIRGWKRPTAIVAGAAVAASLAVVVVWEGLLLRSPSPVVAPPPARSVPPVSTALAPAPAPAKPSAPAVEPPVAPTVAPPSRVAPSAPVTPPKPVAPPTPAAAAAPVAPPASLASSAPVTAVATARATPPTAPAPSKISGVTSASGESDVTAIAAPQAQKKTYRVGWLDSGRASAPYQDIVKQSLVGYPREIAFEYRSADGRTDRLPDLAADLVRLKVDIVFAVGNQAIQAARQATSTIPIVMVGADGVGARRDDNGANVTGVAYSSADLARSWLKLLKEVRPTLGRVAVLYGSESNRSELANLQAAAASAGVQIQPHVVQGADALGSLFAGPSADRADAIIVPGGPMNLLHLSRIVDLAGRARVPTVYGSSEFADAGGLFAYGPSTIAMYRRAGAYIGKILGPTDPRDLPVEQPSRFELVINLKTARALGLTLPGSLVLRADRVVQ